MIVDRLRRRPLLIAANLGGATLVCALLLVHGRGQVWLIYLVMFGYGAVNSLITSAQTALLPALVPGDLLGDANSVLQMASQGLRLITPLLGAGLLAWVGARPVILLDAGTFVVAAACRARAPAARAAAGPGGRAPAGRRAGRVQRRDPVHHAHAGAAPGDDRGPDRGDRVRASSRRCRSRWSAQGLHRSPPFLGVLTTLQGRARWPAARWPRR